MKILKKTERIQEIIYNIFLIFAYQCMSISYYFYIKLIKSFNQLALAYTQCVLQLIKITHTLRGDNITNSQVGYVLID